MPKTEAADVWRLNYRLLIAVIASVAPAINKLGVDTKELFLLAEVDQHPHPAALATSLLMPKPTVTVMVKRLEAAGFLKREIDASDLRRHRLSLTTSGRKIVQRGTTYLYDAFEKRLGRLSGQQQAVLASLLQQLV